MRRHLFGLRGHAGCAGWRDLHRLVFLLKEGVLRIATCMVMVMGMDMGMDMEGDGRHCLFVCVCEERRRKKDEGDDEVGELVWNSCSQKGRDMTDSSSDLTLK